MYETVIILIQAFRVFVIGVGFSSVILISALCVSYILEEFDVYKGEWCISQYNNINNVARHRA